MKMNVKDKDSVIVVRPSLGGRMTNLVVNGEGLDLTRDEVEELIRLLGGEPD